MQQLCRNRTLPKHNLFWRGGGGRESFFFFFFFLVYVYSVYILKSMDSSLMDTRKTLVPFTDLVALVTVICDF